MNKNNILRDLRQLESLLSKHRVKYLSVIRDLRARVEASPEAVQFADVAEDLQRMFKGGGMGSFSDVWISKRNGHVVEDEAAANRQLDTLRESLRNEVQKD